MDFKKYAAQVLYDSVYRPMLDAFSDVWATEVSPYLELLKNVRNKEVDNRSIKGNTIKMLGWDFELDQFTDDQLTQLIDILVKFQRTRGSSAFFQLIGWVKDTPFQLIPLWTSDYTEFAWDSGNVKAMSVVKGGEWWPTNHVDLLYDFSQGVITHEDIEKLFYEVAPAQLVLHQVVGSVGNGDRNPGGSGSGDYGGDNSGGDIEWPDPDDFDTEEEYQDELEKIKRRLGDIFYWQNVPAYYQQANVASYVDNPTVHRNVAFTSGRVERRFTGDINYNLDVRYLYNGAMKGITYSRQHRLVRFLPGLRDTKIIEPDDLYYSSEGWIYSSDANTNLFVNSTKPRTQSIELNPGVYTIWNRGFDGSIDIRFDPDVVIEQPVNNQQTFEFQTKTRLIIVVHPGITFVQVEPKEMRTQGIYTANNLIGIKARDHFWTDIDKQFSVVFDFKLMHSDYIISDEELYKGVFAFGDFLVECKLGKEADRSDSMIKFSCRDWYQEELLSNYERNDGFARLEFRVKPTGIIFINKDKERVNFTTLENRVWFGSNKGRNNAPLFIEQILLVEGDQ